GSPSRSSSFLRKRLRAKRRATSCHINHDDTDFDIRHDIRADVLYPGRDLHGRFCKLPYLAADWPRGISRIPSQRWPEGSAIRRLAGCLQSVDERRSLAIPPWLDSGVVLMVHSDPHALCSGNFSRVSNPDPARSRPQRLVAAASAGLSRSNGCEQPRTSLTP